MNIKESLRGFQKSSNTFEKMWIILQWKKTLHYAKKYSDVEYTNYLWKKHCGKYPNLENPKTFNEKLWFLKLSNRDPLLTKCSDKHMAREYVADCGYPEILKKEYFCVDSLDDVDFKTLPESCYIKCNHASGMNYIYRKGNQDNIGHIKWKFNYMIKENPYLLSREWNYKNIEPKIIGEEVLEMPDGMSQIPELQFFCFNGEPKFIMYNLGLAGADGRHKEAIRWVFDMDWNLIPVKTSMPSGAEVPEIPENYKKMVEIAKKLSAPFPHVRVDLFNIEGKIYFNELTFYSGGGFVKLEPEQWQYTFGDYIDCFSYTIAEDAYERH